jgi:4-amino-4-deoxy-L-arabinose transferase and related glycosyltransferases of PMT family
MVYDYLRSSIGADPVAFAGRFYVRYPKVAIGHWPPVFYLLQALWYLPFGSSAPSVRTLMGLITAASALLLFTCLCRHWDTLTAALSTVLFLCFPLVLPHSFDVMSDLLLTLFCLAAVTSFCSALEQSSPRRWLAFAAWSILAILTKGNGWCLGIFAILAPLISRRPQCFKDPRYWIAGLVILAAALPFYVISTRSNLGYAADPAQVAGRVGQFYRRFWILKPLFTVAAPLTFLVALIGASGSGASGRLRRSRCCCAPRLPGFCRRRSSWFYFLSLRTRASFSRSCRF